MTNTAQRLASAIRRGLPALLIATGVGWVALAAESGPKPYHADAKAMEQTSLAVSGALILEDMQVVREALNKMAEISPALVPEAKEIYGQPIYDADRALQQTLTRAREFAAFDNVSRAFDEFIWVRRVCKNCHDAARKEGRLPESGPLRSSKP